MCSIILCAKYKIAPPGVSYTPRLFIPTQRFSQMSTKPTPLRPPISLSVVKISSALIFLSFTATGIPFSKSIFTYSPASGASSGTVVFLSMCL